MLQGDSAGVGSVIKCGDEDDPIGVSTVLPLSVHRGAAPLQQLRAFLAGAAGEHRKRLEKVGAGARRVGEARGWRLLPGGCVGAAARLQHPRSGEQRCFFHSLAPLSSPAHG